MLCDLEAHLRRCYLSKSARQSLLIILFRPTLAIAISASIIIEGYVLSAQHAIGLLSKLLSDQKGVAGQLLRHGCFPRPAGPRGGL